MAEKTYTLQKDNAVKVVTSEVKRAHWLSLGYTEIETKDEASADKKGGKGGKESNEPPAE